ncbi:hypothetical protein Scel_16180 [Streptomyces cellostaticus]|nr:hypothetical protein Scel_16180 [Streptomyces cellostaticus]
MYGGTQLWARLAAVRRAAYMASPVTVPAPRGPRAYRKRHPETSSGPVVTWGTPPRWEGCRSASQGLALTLMTVLSGK